MGQRGLRRQGVAPALSEQLLLSIAEQLKLPLLQIARRAELSLVEQTTDGLQEMQTSADMAIRLLDNYLFGARLALDPLRAAHEDQAAAIRLDDRADRDLRIDVEDEAALRAHRPFGLGRFQAAALERAAAPRTEAVRVGVVVRVKVIHTTIFACPS